MWVYRAVSGGRQRDEILVLLRATGTFMPMLTVMLGAVELKYMSASLGELDFVLCVRCQDAELQLRPSDGWWIAG